MNASHQHRGTSKPSFQALCFSQPMGSNWSAEQEKPSYFDTAMYNMSWGKTQKIKLNKRNWFISKSTLTNGIYTSRSITCCTHTARFWAPPLRTAHFPSISLLKATPLPLRLHLSGKTALLTANSCLHTYWQENKDMFSSLASHTAIFLHSLAQNTFQLIIYYCCPGWQH